MLCPLTEAADSAPLDLVSMGLQVPARREVPFHFLGSCLPAPVPTDALGSVSLGLFLSLTS